VRQPKTQAQALTC
jgi:hypothetical protein